MEIDVSRFARIRDELCTLAAEHRGLTGTIFEVSDQRDRAEAIRDRQSEMLGRNPTRNTEIGEANDAALAEAETQIKKFVDELAVLNSRLDVLSQRRSALNAIERSCRAWARAEGVSLPDDAAPVMISLAPASGRGTGPTPASPGAGFAAATAPAPATAFGGVPAAGPNFLMSSRMFNSLVNGRN